MPIRGSGRGTRHRLSDVAGARDEAFAAMSSPWHAVGSNPFEMRACAGIFPDGRAVQRAAVAFKPAAMPNARRLSVPPTDAPSEPFTVVRTRADALYRAAVECCRQHDRAAKLHHAAEPELEHEHADALCAMCDGSLVEMSDAYGAAAGNVHPDRDEPWWHKANALWHASREYARRHAGCNAVGKKVARKHSPDQLSSMQMEYELAASALLALRHAAEAYQKARPGLA